MEQLAIAKVRGVYDGLGMAHFEVLDGNGFLGLQTNARGDALHDLLRLDERRAVVTAGCLRVRDVRIPHLGLPFPEVVAGLQRVKRPVTILLDGMVTVL